MNQKAIDNFWRKVNKVAPDDCWLWTASDKGNGYGQFGVAGRIDFAHRVSWKIHNGDIPAGMCVLHRCDNPRCVNPSHLFLGTKADNVADMIAKGRQARGNRTGARVHPETVARGERSGAAKLTERDIRRIKERYAKGDITQQELARQYGVHQSNISVIVSGKAWKHLK